MTTCSIWLHVLRSAVEARPHGEDGIADQLARARDR